MTFDGLNPPYATVVADPPWQYDDAPTGYQRRSGKTGFLPYSSMDLNEIAELDVGSLAAPGAHLYLWTTQRYLWSTPTILSRWGFSDPLKVLTWCKMSMGQGMGGAFANTTEFAVFARRPVGRLLLEAREAKGLGRAEVHEAVRGGKPTGIVFRWEADDCFPGETDWELLRGLLNLPPMACAPKPVNTTWWNWTRGPHSTKPAPFYDLVEQVSPRPRLELFARAQRLGWDSWGHGYEGAA